MRKQILFFVIFSFLVVGCNSEEVVGSDDPVVEVAAESVEDISVMFSTVVEPSWETPVDVVSSAPLVFPDVVVVYAMHPEDGLVLAGYSPRDGSQLWRKPAVVGDLVEGSTLKVQTIHTWDDRQLIIYLPSAELNEWGGGLHTPTVLNAVDGSVVTQAPSIWAGSFLDCMVGAACYDASLGQGEWKFTRFELDAYPSYTITSMAAPIVEAETVSALTANLFLVTYKDGTRALSLYGEGFTLKNSVDLDNVLPDGRGLDGWLSGVAYRDGIAAVALSKVKPESADPAVRNYFPQDMTVLGIDLETGELAWLRESYGACRIRPWIGCSGEIMWKTDEAGTTMEIGDSGVTLTGIDFVTGEDTWTLPSRRGSFSRADGALGDALEFRGLPDIVLLDDTNEINALDARDGRLYTLGANDYVACQTQGEARDLPIISHASARTALVSSADIAVPCDSEGNADPDFPLTEAFVRTGGSTGEDETGSTYYVLNLGGKLVGFEFSSTDLMEEES